MPDNADAGMQTRERWLKIEIAAPPALADALSNYLTEIGAQGVIEEEPQPALAGDFPVPQKPHRLIAYLPADVRSDARLASLRRYVASLGEVFPDEAPVTLDTETLDGQNWGEAWKSYFKPLRVSRNIVIKPTWERFSPAGRDIVVEIDPGMAFGTGQHASTRLCIQAIEDLLLKDKTFSDWRVLDVGTGTGILGISSAKLGAGRVVCVDTDPKAAEIAQENVRINDVAGLVTVLNQDVLSIRETFDLLIANLTAKLLIRLRSHLTSLARAGAYLVLSGIVEQNRSDLEERFLGEPWQMHKLLAEKEWLCYVLRKGSPPR